MENFFNYISKPVSNDELNIWFRSNNIISEKVSLFYDFTYSLTTLIQKTYLGEDYGNETRITLSEGDIENHFKWCWAKTIENFIKENIPFNEDGEHYDYFKSFFIETFYKQRNEEIRNSIVLFFNDLFDEEKSYSKSDLDMILSIYKVLNKNINK